MIWRRSHSPVWDYGHFSHSEPEKISSATDYRICTWSPAPAREVWPTGHPWTRHWHRSWQCAKSTISGFGHVLGSPMRWVLIYYCWCCHSAGSIRRSSFGPHTISTAQTQRTYRMARSAKHRGFGGFPMPHRLISSIINKMFPKFQRRLTRTVTIPATTSLVSTRAGYHAPPHAKAVHYISFNAIVGRNSTFHLLTHEQLEELGGVEYRALNALLWLVAGVSYWHFFGS